MKKNILSQFNSRKRDGRKFSEVANETEELFSAWLSTSGIEDSELQAALNSEKFGINSHDSNGFAYVSLEIGNKPIALPFIWHGLMESSKKNFYTDVMLIMFYMLGKINNEENKKLVEKNLQEMKKLIM